MGRKKIKAAIKSHEFTSLASSPIGQLIIHLQNSLESHIRQNTSSKEQAAIEKKYAVQRLKDIKKILQKISGLLNLFDNGNQPSKLSLVKDGIALYSQLYDAKEFDTPANVFYKITLENLHDAVKSSRGKINHFTTTNSSEFKARLKSVLKKDTKKRYEEVLQIPGCNLDHYFAIVDEVIDDLIFTDNELFDAKEIEKRLTQDIDYSFFNLHGHTEQALIISHPSTYDLVAELLDLINQLPDTLEDLVTFLNPKAFTVDIKNSTLAAFIPDRFNFLKISVEHAPEVMNDEQTIQGDQASQQGTKISKELRFKITQHSGREIYFKVEDYYNDFLAGTKLLLSYSLKTYFESYAQTSHVKSELAKISLVQEFVNQEAAQALLYLDEAKQLYSSFNSFETLLASQTSLSAKVQLLDEKINNLDQNIAQLDYLLERNEDYELKKLIMLLAPYPNLLDDLHEAERKKLDVSYSKEQLPEVIVAFNEFHELDVVPIKEKLKFKQHEREEITLLQSYFKNKRAELITQLQRETHDWQEQEVLRWQKDNDQWVQQLNGFVFDDIDLREIEDLSSLAFDKRITAINQLLVEVGRQREKAHDYCQTIKSIRQQIHDSTQSLTLLLKIESEATEKVSVCYRQSKEIVERYNGRVEKAVACLEQQQERLLIQLSKAKAAKALAETMESTDPTVITALRDDKRRRQALVENQLEVQLNQKIAKEALHAEKIALLHLNSDPLANPDPLSILEKDFIEEKTKFIVQRAEALQKIKSLLAQKQDSQSKQKDPDRILSDENLNTSEGISTIVTWLGELITQEGNTKRESQVLLRLKGELFSFCNLAKTLRTLSQDIEFSKMKRKEFAQEAEILAKEIGKLNKKIKTKQDELSTLTKEILVLDKLIFLLTSNQKISTIIAELENLILESNTVELLNYNQEKLLSFVITARNDLSELGELVKNLKIEAVSLVDHTVYQDNLARIEGFIVNSNTKIDQLVINICQRKQMALDEFLIRFEKEFNKFLVQKDSLEEGDLSAQLTKLSGWLNWCSIASEELKCVFDKAELLDRDLHQLTDEIFNAQIGSKIDKFKELEENFKTFYAGLLNQVNRLVDKIGSEFQHNQDQVNLQFAESKATWLMNTAAIDNLNAYLRSFPIAGLTVLNADLETVSSTDELARKIATLLTEFNQFQATLGIKVAINARLGERIEEREKVVDGITTELTHYEEERSKKYYYKDRLFPQEQQRRSVFIQQLKDALQRYKDNGNSEEVLTCIDQKKETFSGFNLQAILNRLVVKINELNKQIPNNYESYPAEFLEEDNAVLHEQAETILNEITLTEPELVTQLKKLYAEIGQLRQFSVSVKDDGNEEHADVAKELAESLQKKVDHFIIDNQKKLINRAASLREKKFFTEFHADFLCHIHSRDDVMSQHTAWLPILANIALASLAVLTLGLAVPVKRYVTELITGEARFFCVTDGLDRVNAIEKASENLAAVVA
ncbi:hypothetical protein [Legionella micdadei]|uniref:Uncharacterized protein n=1 Tax=Legionella micdadei TaxID=451 RepID=A0A098GH17_LEGMI|nr:hypothetical protein [Legionella micdadei]ARG97644.1 hypothetical protein B6N58_08195 [Legionella micdadei]KTD27733.1 hypothetical protein Lmic_2053 [Legionella micdadei]CEG60781.1 protein of unknown function [Legionella micdadei]SCY12978.1 hypothetical protein SAMN02982997_00898 [Legionella micdadei]